METQVHSWSDDSKTRANFSGRIKDDGCTVDIHVLRRAFFQRHLDKGLKAKHLAKHCGISASMLTMLLKGERNLGNEAQRKIESRLGLTPGCFSDGSFLREALLCDFSAFDFSPKNVVTAAQNTRPAESVLTKADYPKQIELNQAPKHTKMIDEVMRDKAEFDLSSLSQMVLLSKCQVSVETVGVKGNELTLMVKLKF